MKDLVYGIHAVREAFSGPAGHQRSELLLVAGRLNARLQELLELAEKDNLKVSFHSREQLDRMTSGASHQGVVLRQAPFEYASYADLLERWQLSGQPAFFLLLDGITDPHNLGAILRSAESAGCHGVILPKDRACPVTATVAKAAAGALAHLPLCRVTNLARTLEELKKQGAWCYGLAGEADATDIYSTSLKGHLALVVGSEDKGLRPNIRKHCDGLLAIPLRGQVTSLNASVAAGIALFEVLRQRR